MSSEPNTVASASPTTLTPERPFPGPRPYTEADAGYFFGRQEETAILERMARRNGLTVLFGASGLGKTSLLRAGLSPALRASKHLPIAIRLDLSRGAPLQLMLQVLLQVRAAAAAAGVELENAADRSTLWEFLHRLEVWDQTSSLLVPVLAFDQFEELFTLGARSKALVTEVHAFIEALGDVVENRLPQQLRDLREDPELREFTRRAAPAKLVLSLREEYLPHLEDRRSQIPSLTQNRLRFWLQPLRGDRAADVVRHASHAADRGPLIDDRVAQLIVRAVANRRHDLDFASERRPALSTAGPDPDLDSLTVEPSLLSLFCFQLNERRLAAHAKVIDEQLLNQAGHDIFDDFYASSVADLDQPVKAFLEDVLISPAGHRLSVPEEDARQRRGIDANTLQVLEARRLIRREYRNGTNQIELVHDVLARTIRTAKRRRVARNRRRIRDALAIAGTSISVVGVIALYTISSLEGDVRNLDTEYQTRKAQTQRAQAEEQAARAAADEQQLLVASLTKQAQDARHLAFANEAKAADAQVQATRATAAAEAARNEATQMAAAAKQAQANRLAAEREVAKQIAYATHLKAEIEALEREKSRFDKRTGVPPKLDSPP